MNEEKLINSLERKTKDCIVKERRHGEDFLLKLINFFGYFIWVILFLIASVCEKAGIKITNLKYVSEKNLNLSFLNSAMVLTVGLFAASFILLCMSLKRCRRRKDKIKISLFIGEIISFVVGIYLLLKLYD